MAAKPLKGVGGVLGGLISSESAAPVSPEPSVRSASAESIAEPTDAANIEQAAPPAAKAKPRPPAQPKTHARRGRPPGRKAGEGGEKEKVTLRLSKELVEEYRDWSWDERCQFGELVERALSQYRKQRIRQKASNA